MSKFHEMWERQEQLLWKFEEIEYKNRALEWPGRVADIDNFTQEMKLRRYAWQITEEIGEALWGKYVSASLSSNLREEIADAFHFLLDLFILSGFKPEHILSATEQYIPIRQDQFERFFAECADDLAAEDVLEESAWFHVILGLTVTMNLLKNRPWRKERRLVDRKMYLASLHGVLKAFIRACISSGVGPDQLHESYFKKAVVNEQRIAGTAT